jgi:hypothetical protein
MNHEMDMAINAYKQTGSSAQITEFYYAAVQHGFEGHLGEWVDAVRKRMKDLGP